MVEAESRDDALESALTSLEGQLTAAARSLKAAAQALKKAHDAARSGNLRDLPRLFEAAAASADQYLNQTRRTGDSWSFAGDEYLGSERYLEELRQAALEFGVRGVRVLDGRLYSYPSIVRVEARDLTVRVGKRKHSGVRPSHLAAILKKAQAKPAQGNLEPTLNAIEQAYLFLTRGQLGHAVHLKEIHQVLTLRPGSARDYTLDDFVMDLYQLDLNGPHLTRNNREFDLPASTSTRGGRGIRFATRDGDEKLYSTIRFQATS
jgi:hypothetical protein